MLANGGSADPGRRSRPSRRAVLAGLPLLSAGLGFSATAAQPQVRKAEPRPRDAGYEVLEVGPGKRFASLTLAGCYMNSAQRWSAEGVTPDRIAQMRFRVIISPGPPGYYVNDSGSHSRRWKEMVGWPPYEGVLLGPVVIEGEPGKPAPLLCTDGYADGALYYEKGLFCTGNFDATFRHLKFRGFRRQDGNGNIAAIRLGEAFLKAPMASRVLIEDCEFSACDNGVMGGSPGESVTLRNCYFHHNGNGSGRVHNIYIGSVDELLVEDVLSTDCTIGHLLKTRAARTTIRRARLLGGAGTESACLDVPDGGVLDIDGLVCEKSPDSDASWIIHYSGENGSGFHAPSSIRIRNLTLLAPARLRRRSGQVVGFANQSGLGEASSGKGAHFIAPDAQNVQVFNLTPSSAGLPCKVLATPPRIDRSAPRIA